MKYDLLKMHETMSYSEIANILGISRGAVAGRLFRLRNPLYDKKYYQSHKEYWKKYNKL